MDGVPEVKIMQVEVETDSDTWIYPQDQVDDFEFLPSGTIGTLVLMQEKKVVAVFPAGKWNRLDISYATDGGEAKG